MTPREPDRYEAKARELVDLFITTRTHVTEMRSALAAALRQAESSALERAAQIADESREDGRCIAFAIRALASPAAVPAAETVNHPYQEDHEAMYCAPSEFAAPADPCQRCGKLGGHGVEFRFDGISMSSWICPHCLDVQEKRIAELESAIRWALGEEDDFPTREPGEGAYWWRTELRRRAKLAARAATVKP